MCSVTYGNESTLRTCQNKMFFFLYYKPFFFFNPLGEICFARLHGQSAEPEREHAGNFSRLACRGPGECCKVSFIILICCSVFYVYLEYPWCQPDQIIQSNLSFFFFLLSPTFYLSAGEFWIESRDAVPGCEDDWSLSGCGAGQQGVAPAHRLHSHADCLQVWGKKCKCTF